MLGAQWKKPLKSMVYFGVLAVERQPAPNRIRNTRNCPQWLLGDNKNTY